MGRIKGSASTPAAARRAGAGDRDRAGADAAADAADRGARASGGADRGSPERRESSSDNDDSRLTGAIPDLFRRAMALGLSGFFTTEETIRKAVGDTLPQDWVDFASAQSERTRSELMARMSEEIGRVMERVELVELFERLLEGRTIEVTAQIRLGERREPRESEGSSAGREATVRVEVAGGEKSDT
ncbi:MAG: hypothetical protein ACQGVK_09275 [Myxococcota bacterium]